MASQTERNEGPDPGRLERVVRALEGERHPHLSPGRLGAAEDLVAGALADLGLRVERVGFEFGGRRFDNVVGRKPGRDPDRATVLVGAHVDTVPGTPGADDNASGVAGMLEAARLLADDDLAADVEFAGFNLEEPQGRTYRVGSRRFAARARRRGAEYAGCLVLEMIGYTDPTPGAQRVPPLLFWKRVPRTGTFVAATGDRRSRPLLRAFRESAAGVAGLECVAFRTPFRGWAVPETRLSDNASFWDRGYPALMITDTSFLRNPHYHRPTDTADTLDYRFMARVVEATVATVRRVAGS